MVMTGLFAARVAPASRVLVIPLPGSSRGQEAHGLERAAAAAFRPQPIAMHAGGPW